MSTSSYGPCPEAHTPDTMSPIVKKVSKRRGSGMTQRCKRTARAGGVALALIAATATAGTGPAAAASRSPFETVNHTFPSHVTYATGVLPSASQAARDTAVERQYDSWK